MRQTDGKRHPFAQAAEWLRGGREFVLAVVVRAEGSTPRKPGAKMLISASGEISGSVGGGEVESDVIERAGALLAGRKGPCLMTFDLSDAENPACGGQLQVFLDPVFAPRHVLIFGAGHVAAALCPLLVTLGFSVTLFDNRQDRLEMPEFSSARRIVAPYTDLEKHLSFNPDLHILVMTPEHSYDIEVLRRVIEMDWYFLGVMGSFRKRKQIFDVLGGEGISEELIEKIRIPLGVDIGSETPDEIAVSIAGELIRLHADPKKLWNRG